MLNPGFQFQIMQLKVPMNLAIVLCSSMFLSVSIIFQNPSSGPEPVVHVRLRERFRKTVERSSPPGSQGERSTAESTEKLRQYQQEYNSGTTASIFSVCYLNVTLTLILVLCP